MLIFGGVCVNHTVFDTHSKSLLAFLVLKEEILGHTHTHTLIGVKYEKWGHNHRLSISITVSRLEKVVYVLIINKIWLVAMEFMATWYCEAL